MKRLLLSIVSLFLSTIDAPLRGYEKIEYEFSHELIDVVIPCHEKDIQRLEYVIQGIRENILFGRIFVVSHKKFTDSAEWFDEQHYPFSKYDIAYEIFQDKERASRFISAPDSRIGWIYQQFLKLYAPLVIPGISANVLIVDADLIFLRHTTFQAQNGAPLFAVGTEHHRPYFALMHRLIPGLQRVFEGYSGITHHMLFQRSVLTDLFDLVEQIHDKPFWKAVCRCIDHNEVSLACFSEYELYFNYIFTRSNQPAIRFLQSGEESFKDFLAANKEGFDYIACHSWRWKLPTFLHIIG